MNALERELREIIAAEGPLSVETYMSLCLQHPLHGYYTTREVIGRGGDFVTAPEIDQMFGELIGLWAAQTWIGMGAPAVVRLVELGPGRGTLMADMLRAARVVPGFRAAVHVDLVETSPRLRALQQDKLDGVARVAWHAAVDDVPDGPAIVVANEFFDALPVRHYLRSARGWHERHVGLGADGALAFGAAAEPVEIGTAGGAPGQVLEIGHAALRTMEHIARRLAVQGGAMLVCDYGHAETAFGETLQAMRGHAYADVLANPGEADLTAHVDFAALARTARAAGATAYGPVAQGRFLERLGIVQRAAALRAKADTRQTAALDAALARFIGPASSMATVFKAFAVTAPGVPAPVGFEDASQVEIA